MFTYQVRPRIFRLEEAQSLTWPAEAEIRFHLQPLQPFGVDAGGGRTAVRAVPATVHFDANSGAHTIESRPPLRPLEVEIEEPNRAVSLNENILTLNERFDSLGTLAETIESIYFGFPMLLNVEFADPPFIERVDGSIGSSAFRWELTSWKMEFRTTTQNRQESVVAKVWERMNVISHPERRRLLAALHYFYVACRLARSGSTPGEFLSEVLLNLTKTLEVLFPPTGDGRSRDAVRLGLRQLDFSDDDIEGNFIPAMALRNEVDVGHVELGVFNREQLKVLHAYTDRAERAFHDLLDRVLTAVESGETEIIPYELQAPRGEAMEVIERLRKHTPPDAV